MNEEKEDSRKTNKWVVILIILVLAFLGFYFYNQFSSLFLETTQETLEERVDNEETEQTTTNDQEKQVSEEEDKKTDTKSEFDEDKQITSEDKKEQTSDANIDEKERATTEENNQVTQNTGSNDNQNGELPNEAGDETQNKEEQEAQYAQNQQEEEETAQTEQAEDIVKKEDRREDGKFGREIDLIIIGQDQKKNVKEGKVQSDSIILANLKPKKKVLTLTAVPSHKEYKGHKLQTYDRNQLVNIMNEITGISPDYYFVIDYEGFKNIVNLISGVEVNINKRFEVPELGLYLKPGRNLLSGQEALNYARYYDEEENELTRIKRQQQVMEGFANKIFQRNTLLDIPRLYKTVIQTIKNVKTNFDYELAIEAYNFISNSSDFDIKYDVLEIR